MTHNQPSTHGRGERVMHTTNPSASMLPATYAELDTTLTGSLNIMPTKALGPPDTKPSSARDNDAEARLTGEIAVVNPDHLVPLDAKGELVLM